MNNNLNETAFPIFEDVLLGLAKKSLPEFLEELPNQKLMQLFYGLKSNTERIQELVLQDILKQACNSQLGQKEAFSDIKTIKQFKDKLPITQYCDYEAYIEPMTKGEKNILFHGDTMRFIATSGTTGIAKLLPESKNGESVKALVSRMRLILLLSLAPEIMMPEKKVLSITNPAEYAKTEANIPIGSASGQAVKDIPVEMRQKLILPVELILAKDLSSEAMDYLILLFALAEENLAGVVCSNIAHFNILLGKIKGAQEDLLKDIRTGEVNSKLEIDQNLKTILSSKLIANPQRADNLKKIFECNATLDVERIWPHFLVVSCWMAASSERIVEDVKRYLPSKIRFLEWGYGASEGKFNLPSLANDPSGDLALFGYFFEFLPLGGTDTLLAHELRQGEYYEIIITSYSGLYRYNMKDIVYVQDVINQAPRIVFAAKSTEYLKLNEMELFVFEIERDLKIACEQVQEEIRFYQVIADEKEQKLVFVVEPVSNKFQGQAFIKKLEKIICTNHSNYRYYRENQQLGVAEILVMKQGYRDDLFTRSIMPGKNVNQTKLKTIVDKYPEESNILSHDRGDAE